MLASKPQSSFSMLNLPTIDLRISLPGNDVTRALQLHAQLNDLAEVARQVVSTGDVIPLSRIWSKRPWAVNNFDEHKFYGIEGRCLVATSKGLEVAQYLKYVPSHGDTTYEDLIPTTRPNIISCIRAARSTSASAIRSLLKKYALDNHTQPQNQNVT